MAWHLSRMMRWTNPRRSTSKNITASTFYLLTFLVLQYPVLGLNRAINIDEKCNSILNPAAASITSRRGVQYTAIITGKTNK
jgi:hypothetical protein